MTVDASRSCLGLGTCVGSAIRQIVDARVLLTATVPPALPGRSMSDAALAPPYLDVITHFLHSAWRDCHLPSNCPNETRQLASDRGGDDIRSQGEPRTLELKALIVDQRLEAFERASVAAKGVERR